MQQFFVEMSYNGNGVGTNNTLTLSATPYSLPTAYVGNVVYPTYINLPANSSSISNSSDIKEPTVDPTTAKYNTVQKIEIYGAFVIGFLFVIIVIILIVICCNGNA